MNQFYSAVTRELNIVETQLRQSLRNSRSNGKGCLQARDKNGRTYYYRQYRNGKKRITDYLGPAGSEKVARFILDKASARKRKTLEKNRALLKELLRNYEPWDDQRIISGLNFTYINAYNECRLTELAEKHTNAMSFAEHRELWEWASEDYEKNQLPMLSPTRTCDGTLVRSKGECIWYNALTSAGLPFRYESRLSLEDENGFQHDVYPDFMLMSIESRLILIEHLGMLLDDEYRKKFGDKLALYMKNGYVPGDNLIITCDAPDHSINSEAIADLIESRLKKLVFG